ncbi:RusA family crossover junction endodeoxyribonuclease [Lentilitoribacter sp. Alg239-R112]|uniref:RusA family crossover junction endodeoxyribonuclease n=1 Tax=Lentilitoribacter sp. Alg239-R112 TaxID=2305987 RepID=UPI0013A692DB|nr:RusA family crossover junction endodeoxyribonuclease [Lentilitoribacter sp. Alg239-R112]
MTRIELPMPPSVNVMYSNARKSRIKSPAYRTWLQEAGLLLNTQHPKPISGAVEVYIVLVAQSKHRQDADNRVKAVLDLLTTHKIIEDDSSDYVKDLRVRWMDSGPACVVTISSISKENAA